METNNKFSRTLPLPANWSVDNALNSADIVQQLKLLNDNPGFVYNHGISVDYTFALKEGCTADEILKVETSIKHSLPDDYKNFLQHSDGLGFSGHIGSFLSGVNDICKYKDVFNWYPDNVIVVGSVYDGSVHILIDLEKDDNENMFVYDVYEATQMQALDCGFIDFLNRFIMTYGSAFWEWAKGRK